MGIFSKKNKKGNISINLEYIDGIPGYKINSAVAVSLNTEETNLEIEARVFKAPPVKLNFNQIISFNLIDEKTIIEKKKSIMGRAFVGTLLLGPAGAILGGLSAVDPKKIKKNNMYLIFNYTKKDTDEVNVLTFKICGATFHLSKFIDELHKLIPLDQEKINSLIKKYTLNEKSEEIPKEIIL